MHANHALIRDHREPLPTVIPTASLQQRVTQQDEHIAALEKRIAALEAKNSWAT